MIKTNERGGNRKGVKRGKEREEKECDKRTRKTRTHHGAMWT